MAKSNSRLTPNPIDAENLYDAIETGAELGNESDSWHPASASSLMTMLERLEPIVEDFPAISDSPPLPVDL